MQRHYNREEEVRPRLPLCLLSISMGQVLSAQTLTSTIVGRVGQVSDLYRDAAIAMWAAGSGPWECCLYAASLLRVVHFLQISILSSSSASSCFLVRSNRRPSVVGCRLF